MKESDICGILLSALLISPLNIYALDIPVAILSTNTDGETKTLTFTYADSVSATDENGKDGVYKLNTGHNAPGWLYKYEDYEGEIEYSSPVTKVIFEPSFASARPTSTCMWFYEMGYLDSIQGIEYLNTSEVTDMSGMFKWKQTLTNIDVSHFDTRNVTDMSCMFEQCHALTSVDLSSFNTEKVTSMEYMFDYCGSLDHIDVSNFNTENVVNMGGMFMDTGLKNIDVSGFNTKNVKYMYGMFYRCDSLKSVDLSNFSFESIEDATELLAECPSLTSLNMGSNDLKGLSFEEEDGYNGEPFEGVGTADNPCTLIINSDFDKSVLGEQYKNGSTTYYIWHGGYFSEPTVVTAIKGMSIRNNKTSSTYNILGQEVGDESKGIIITNGHKYIRK